MADNYFDEDVARSYDALESDMFDPAVLDLFDQPGRLPDLLAGRASRPISLESQL
jgi:hypothetical protein